MDPLRNPYTPGAGTPPPALTGRDDELDRFRLVTSRAMARQAEKSLLITGLRGVGKTVLLNTFSDIAEGNGLKTAPREITEGEDFRSLLARLARRTLLSMSPLDRLKASGRRALGVLKGFTMTTPEGFQLGLDVDAILGVADSGNLEDDLPELLVQLGVAAADHGTGVAILLDEIQYLSRDELAALIVGAHRLSQRVLPVVIVGAGLPQLPALVGDAKSYAERLFDVREIGSLPKAAAEEAIIRPARERGADVDIAAATKIFELSEGYPYFLQEYGKHVWNLADSSPITLHDVEAAMPAVQQQLDDNFFQIRIARVTGAKRRYLRAMAELGPGPYRSGDIADKLGQKVTSVGPLRSQLIHDGYIYSPSHGLTDFTVPQFDQFMRRTYPFSSS